MHWAKSLYSTSVSMPEKYLWRFYSTLSNLWSGISTRSRIPNFLSKTIINFLMRKWSIYLVGNVLCFAYVLAGNIHFCVLSCDFITLQLTEFWTKYLKNITKHAHDYIEISPVWANSKLKMRSDVEHCHQSAFWQAKLPVMGDDDGRRGFNGWFTVGLFPSCQTVRISAAIVLVFSEVFQIENWNEENWEIFLFSCSELA